MADWRDSGIELRAAGATLAALSVDDPSRSEPLRRVLELDYTLLCDPNRTAVRAFGLLNTAEHGGIAFPAVFVIEPGRVVRWRALETTASRVEPKAVLTIVRSKPENADIVVVPRGVWPGAMWMRALMNGFTRGFKVKWSK